MTSESLKRTWDLTQTLQVGAGWVTERARYSSGVKNNVGGSKQQEAEEWRRIYQRVTSQHQSNHHRQAEPEVNPVVYTEILKGHGEKTDKTSLLTVDYRELYISGHITEHFL